MWLHLHHWVNWFLSQANKVSTTCGHQMWLRIFHYLPLPLHQIYIYEYIESKGLLNGGILSWSRRRAFIDEFWAFRPGLWDEEADDGSLCTRKKVDQVDLGRTNAGKVFCVALVGAPKIVDFVPLWPLITTCRAIDICFCVVALTC